MSDSFLYSGDDAAMMSEVQHYHIAARQFRSICSGAKPGCQLGHHWHLLLNVHAKGMYEHLCKYLFNIYASWTVTVTVSLSWMCLIQLQCEGQLLLNVVVSRMGYYLFLMYL